jgi:putative hemolysin
LEDILDAMLLEILIILLMILFNGFFSCSEFAIVSVRKSRIAQLLAEGDDRARIVDELQKDPHRVLAVVQIGVTVAASMASTVAGTIAIENIKPLIAGVPYPVIQHAAEPVAVMLVVIIVSYVSLIIGELVPKAIALQYAETIALNVARPISVISRYGSIAVSFLTYSSKTVMRILRISSERGYFITREEVQHIVTESEEFGAISQSEKEYIHNLFEFTHTAVREVMVPRTRIVGIDIASTREEIIALVQENMYSRYPVFLGEIEDIIGVVHSKDLLSKLVAGDVFDLSAIMKPPVFVPESKKVNDLLKQMQRSHNQMALVVDEYGGLNGLVTSEDLIEELLGEIRDEHDAAELGNIQRLKDGELIVDGFMTVSDLADIVDIKPEDNQPYDTVAGLILHVLGRFPAFGESIDWQGYRFVCEEVTRKSILRVRIIQIKE